MRRLPGFDLTNSSNGLSVESPTELYAPLVNGAGYVLAAGRQFDEALTGTICRVYRGATGIFDFTISPASKPDTNIDRGRTHTLPAGAGAITIGPMRAVLDEKAITLRSPLSADAESYLARLLTDNTRTAEELAVLTNHIAVMGGLATDAAAKASNHLYRQSVSMAFAFQRSFESPY